MRRVLSAFLCLAYAPLANATDKGPRLFTHKRERNGLQVGAYLGNYTNSDILRIPVDLIHGNLTFRNAQIAGLMVAKPLWTFGIPLGEHYRFDGFSLDGEVQLLTHLGLESYWEAVGSLVLRSGEIRLGPHAGFNLAFGQGLSYASSPPKLELGAGQMRGVDTPQFLYHLAAEAELTFAGARGFSTFGRIHHRSGVFGFIAPGYSGSNYMGLGVRYRFR
jgi:hypothetical protein